MKQRARPRRSYDFRLLLEGLMFAFALFVLIVVASLDYRP